MANPNEETPQSLASVLLKGNMSLSAQHQHPMEIHPILRISKAIPDALASSGSSESQQMIVDKVSVVLASLSCPSGDSDQEMSESKEENEEKETIEEVET